MKQISTSTFMGLIDDIILCSKADPLLREGIEIMDRISKEMNESIYETILHYLSSDPLWQVRVAQ